MPRRKSATQGASTKRPLDDDFEFDTPGKKSKVQPQVENNDKESAAPSSSKAGSVEVLQGKAASNVDDASTAATVTLTMDTPEETKVKGITIEPLSVTTSKIEGETLSTSSQQAEKRNLSLELLCEVGSSELQNITRQSPGATSPFIIIDNNKDSNSKTTQEAPSSGRRFVRILSDNSNRLICIQNNPNVSAGGDTDLSEYASVVEISGEDLTWLRNESDKVVITSEGSATQVNNLKVTDDSKKKRPPGRHVCPFCGRRCAKPSVLQKHLRAHTGERPFPCTSCGFAFKTKSNLYKHCKSRSHALKAIVSEGKIASAGTSINLQEEGSEEEMTDDAEEMAEKGSDLQLQGTSLDNQKTTYQNIVELPSSPAVKVEKVNSFEKREHAPLHVLQSVAKYLEKPKAERPKVEIQEVRPENFRPRITTKLKKLKLTMERDSMEIAASKLQRSSSVQEQGSKSTSILRRAVSVIDQQAPINVMQSVPDYLNRTNIEISSDSTPGVLKMVQSSSGFTFVPVTVARADSAPGRVILSTSKPLPKLAPKSKKNPEEKFEASDNTLSALSSDGKIEQFVMHKTNSGGSLSIRPLTLHQSVTPKGDAETIKRPILVKQNAIDVKSDKSFDVASQGSQTDIIFLPNTQADQSKSLKALRELEQLTEKCKKESLSGYHLLPAIMSFPDGSCQVTLQYVPKQENTTAEEKAKKEQNDNNKVKILDSEMLKQRIQNLISTNAKIVKTPMADPPRYKRPTTRQNSEYEIKEEQSVSPQVIVNKPENTSGVGGSASSLIQTASILSQLNSGNLIIQPFTPSEKIHGIKSIVDPGQKDAINTESLQLQMSEIAKQLTGLKSPAVIQTIDSAQKTVEDVKQYTVGSTGSITKAQSERIILPKVIMNADYKALIDKIEKGNDSLGESDKIKGSVKDRIKEKLKSREDSALEADGESSRVRYGCQWCDISFSDKQILELHKEYYCRGKHSSERPSMISTDKIIQVFSGFQTGTKEMVKTYSMESNMKVVKNETDKPQATVPQNNLERNLPVSNALPTKSPHQLLRCNSLPSHPVQVIPHGSNQFQTVTVWLPNSVANTVQLPASVPLTSVHEVQNKKEINQAVGGKSEKQIVEKEGGVENKPDVAVVKKIPVQFVGSLNSNILSPQTAPDKQPMFISLNQLLKQEPLKNITKDSTHVPSKQDSAIETSLAAASSPQTPPAWKEKLKDKLLRRSLSVDKLIECGRKITKSQSLQNEIDKKPFRTTAEDRASKCPFSESRFLNQMLDEVNKHKISRLDSAPMILQKKASKESKADEKAKVTVPVVMAQPVYNIEQINSYRMFQDSSFGDGVLRSSFAGGNWLVSAVSAAGKFKMSVLKAALLGVENLKNMSDQEKLFVMQECEKENINKMETDVEDDGKESQNQLAQMLLLHNYPSLRWSTHPSFCCISRPQPMYVPLTNHKKISMYSNWRTSPHNANPAGLSTDTLLSMYCSREHQNPEFIQAGGTSTKEGILTHSSYWTFTGQKNVAENKAMDTTDERQLPDEKEKGKQDALKLVKGGHKSFDSYTYVRGRGRGKYVCNECGIRCKKPSMLKKHIRSHTNLRPYKCRHCHLSFKTKGNLTKHMNTKSHHRRCLDQGIFPVPTQVDDSQIDPVALSAQFELSKKARIILKGGEVMPLDLTGVDEESDEEDGENAEEDNGELDGSKDSETMSATEVSALEEDMRMEIEEAVPKSEELHTERSSCIHSVGSGLVGSVPVICSTIQSQALMVSVVTTANQSSSSSDGQQQMTSTILSNGKSDPRSLGTVYGFGDTHVEVIDSEVAKSLLALSKEEEEKNKKGYDSAVNTGDETTVESSDCIQIGETTGKDLLSSSTVECPESRIEDQNYSGEFQTNCDVTVKGEEEDVNKTTDTEAPRLENSSQNSVASNKLNFKESDITFTIPLGGYMPTMGTSHVRKSGNKPSNLGPIVGQLVRQRPITLQLNNLANTPTCQSTPLHIPFQFQHPFPESSAEIPVVDNIEISSTSSEAPADVPIENEIQVNLVLVTDVPNLSQTVPVLQEEKPSTGSMTEYKVQVENDTVQHAIEPSGTASVQVIAGPSTEKPLVLSGDNGTYKCNMCGKTFSEQQHLILHRKIHFMEPTYSCSVCGNRYRTHQQCKVHCDNHNKNPTHIFATKENPRPFRCTECNIGFRTRFHLSRHFKSRLHVYKLEELKIIPQGTYGYVEEILYTLDSYSSEGFLKLLLDNLKERNIMEKLKESEQLVSEVRRRRSSHDITAKVALPVDYNEEEDDVLIIEDESSKSSSVDNNVENVSHFEPQNTSTRVEKMRDNELHVEAENPRAEFQKNELASNDKVTVEIKHEQYEMGDIFGTKAKSDDEEGESSEVHLCVICNRGFINLQHLKNHMISHAELRPYVCEYCDAGFTKAQSLKTHLQSHAQERPYVCGMCGDTFAGSESLKLHNKEKHSMKVDPVSMRDEETKAQLPMKCMDAESAKSDTMDIQTEGVVVNFTISKDEGKEDAVDLESKGDEDQSQQHEGEGQGEEYMETKIESKSPSSVSDRMIFQGEGSQYSSYQVEGFCSIQKMELGEEINIELNTEYEEMEEEDLQGKLKNDPVLARVGENDDDKQPNFSDNSSDGYFNQSDDVTHEEHEFKDPML